MLEKKVVDNRKKNTKRKISKKMAWEVEARDGYCIICEYGTISQIHHAFYGDQANYGENRNDSNQLVGLCNTCHDKLHARGGNDYREYCIHYLRTRGFL